MRLHVLVDDVDVARTAVADGATVVQLRRKGASTRQLVEAAEPFLELPATVVVNDDVDAALTLGVGVHLGQHDPGVDRARAARILLGLSATTLTEAIDIDRHGASYIGAGPVWATPSKPDAAPAIGLDGLAAICDAVSTPVVAIGGVDAGNAGDCIRVGAFGVAVMRAATHARALRDAIDTALDHR